MSEKPQKRLVGWKHYLRTQSAAWTANGIGMALGFVGVVLLGLAVCGLILSITIGLMGVVMSVLAGGLGYMSIRFGGELLRKADDIEAVTLITKHNTGLLPEVETLVRSSDLPSTHQQAELLRAAKPGQEMPPEELLRASVTTSGSQHGRETDQRNGG